MGHGHSSERQRRTSFFNTQQASGNATNNNNNNTTASPTPKHFKILLLGTGEGGKATIWKQMTQHLSADTHFDELTRKPFTPIIHRNAFLCMYALCRGATEKLNLTISNTERLAKIHLIKDQCTSFENWRLTPEAATLMKEMWTEEEAIQQAYHQRDKLESSMESSKYWFDNIERIADVNYIPSYEDILRMRVKTTGIVETRMEDRRKTCQTEHEFSIVLMGSQRNERKKWIHAFDHVSAVIFVVALSEYNQMLYEDGVTNRLTESLVLFTELVNSPRFEGVPFYVYFNKQDLFLEKLQYFDLTPVFPELPQQLKLLKPWNTFIGGLISKLPKELIEYTRNNEYTTKTIYEDPILGISPARSAGSSATTNGETLNPFDQRLKGLQGPPTQVPKITCSPAVTSPITKKDSRLIIIKRKPSNLMPGQLIKLSDLPTDTLMYIALFLDAQSLCRMSASSYELYQMCSSEVVWRSLCMSFQPLISEEAVQEVYDTHYMRRLAQQVTSPRDKYEESISPNSLSPRSLSPGSSSLSTSPRNGYLSTSPSQLISSSMTTIQIESAKTKSTLSSALKKVKRNRLQSVNMWKFYYEFGSQFIKGNTQYVISKFLEKSQRRDCKVFVTCAVDTISIKPVIDVTFNDIIRRCSGSSPTAL